MWTKISVLLQKPSDLGLHCLTKMLLKNFRRLKKQTTFVVIGTLRVDILGTFSGK